jgi:hypothetical protein
MKKDLTMFRADPADVDRPEQDAIPGDPGSPLSERP